MGVRDVLTKSPVPKKRITLGAAEGLETEIEVELWGLTVGERSDVQEQGYDRNMNPRMKTLYPLVLGPGMREVGTGARVFGDSREEWEAGVNAITHSPVADRCFLEICTLSGLNQNGKGEAKNGSRGGENSNTTSPIGSDGEA